MNLIVMGPPGAGKGTQSRWLGERLDVPVISTGEMLRDEIKRKTALGTQAKRHMDKGELIPDALMIRVIEERLKRQDCKRGFILDGFPRTVAQAEALHRMRASLGGTIERAVSLSVPNEELLKRLSGRRTCRECGAMYHIIFDPPTNEGLCNKCNGELYQRDDDHEDIISSRLEIYDAQTAPVLEYYRKHRQLVEVDGVGGRDDVLDRILAALGVAKS
ncbi:MAG: adenylate kinase [Polyangiaceae bacterium UTPRO1]|jgi:adenylate kinase|nr:adenylate kinase [Myxococcales bacterium]OQY65899.1 MAG: adenylate kinase [Polyangiaceae bacterium UTPRO1]